MTLPPLVPRPGPGQPLAPPDRPARLMPTQKEWTALHPEIERMYVFERRKLRYIMQYIENEHGFKATEQMYKKRLAKWGLQKNSRRSAAVLSSLIKDKSGTGATVKRRDQPKDPPSSVPKIPRLAYGEGLMLLFLNSVRVCSSAFFEFIHSHDGVVAYQNDGYSATNVPSPEQTDKIGITFKLVMELLERGHGNLAGRMARKAFLLVEDLLTLEDPALVWNMLEIMHQMVTLGHSGLFHMLLSHLTALTNGKLPKSHPVSAMLRGLQELVAHLTPLTSPSPSTGTTILASDGSPRQPSPHVLSSLLERAWILNAEIVFANLDSRLLSLYCNMNWNWSSISPTTAIITTANEWLRNLESQQLTFRPTTAVPEPEADQRYNEGQFKFSDTKIPVDSTTASKTATATVAATGKLIQHLLAPRMDVSLPLNYEKLYVSSIAKLREHRDAVFTKEGKTWFAASETVVLLPLLAVLVTTKILEEWPPTLASSSGRRESTKQMIPCVEAENVAWAMRMLMQVKSGHHQGNEDDDDDDDDDNNNNNDDHDDTDGYDLTALSETAIKRIRSIVALREYAHGDTDPRVVPEIWWLVDALLMRGRFQEAQEVEKTAFHRLEKYVQDIPPGRV